MSSHREAPEISKDPVADNTDTYAFVSPDKPDTITIITNYIPLENPPGGPNFFEFGDDVLYSIYVDNDGDGLPNVEYQFKFKTKLRSEKTFLYNTGPISSIDSANWNRRQFYDVSRVDYRTRAITTAASRSRRRSATTCPARVQHRAPLDAELPDGAGRPGGALAEGRHRCVRRGSETRGSSWTWGRSSTSAICVPCRTCT